jgi:hypothetical protein
MIRAKIGAPAGTSSAPMNSEIGGSTGASARAFQIG